MGMNNKSKVIKANYRLQLKAGKGGVDAKKIEESQKVIDTNDVDFTPIALSALRRMETALELAEKHGVTVEGIKASITTPVMELKAHAATFQYPLLGNLSNTMLTFLENIRVLDEDALEIVKAHHKTLHLIVVKEMKGNGGNAGKQLEDELRLVCARYFSKKKPI